MDGWQLSGSIPQTLAALSDLTNVNLGLNQLEGSSPVRFAGWKKLEFFAINDNSKLDWDLSLLESSCAQLQYVMAQVNQLLNRPPSVLNRSPPV